MSLKLIQYQSQNCNFGFAKVGLSFIYNDLVVEISFIAQTHFYYGNLFFLYTKVVYTSLLKKKATNDFQRTKNPREKPNYTFICLNSQGEISKKGEIVLNIFKYFTFMKHL